MVKKELKQKNLVKHVLATEAVMKALAEEMCEDKDVWGMAGLLHDLDYEYTSEEPSKHARMTVEMLKDKDVPEEVLDAILAHNEQKPRETAVEKAIYAADPVTGFIVASVLIRKGTRLEDLDVPFLMNRFKEKSFARGANRDQMSSCEELGLSLESFLGISLAAMQGISKDLGL